MKMRTHHPFNPEVNKGAEGKDDPKDWTDDQPQPEDSWLGIWCLLLPSGLKNKQQQDILTVTTAVHTARPHLWLISTFIQVRRIMRSNIVQAKEHLTFLASNTQWLRPSSSTWFHHRRPTISRPVMFYKHIKHKCRMIQKNPCCLPN